MRRLVLAIFVATLAVGGCAQSPPSSYHPGATACPVELTGGNKLPVRGAGFQGIEQDAAVVLGTEYEYKGPCGLRPNARIRAAAMPADGIFPIAELAVRAAKQSDVPLQGFIVLRAGFGKQSGQLNLVFFHVGQTKAANVVVYTTKEDWEGPLPADQPWLQ